jgi:hypothetical protein
LGVQVFNAGSPACLENNPTAKSLPGWSQMFEVTVDDSQVDLGNINFWNDSKCSFCSIGQAFMARLIAAGQIEFKSRTK